MKKFICALLLVVPAVVFFMNDFGAATVGLRILGVGLVLLVIADYVYNVGFIVPLCKICYFPVYMIYWLHEKWREHKCYRKLRRGIYWF